MITDGMKTALVGAAAVVIGAIITVVGMVHYQQWVEGPKEGVFAVQVSFISPEDIPVEIRDQISKYPCTLKIFHVEGPAIERLSLNLDSSHSLSNLYLVRDDENSRPKISENGKSLSLDLKELRKGSVIEYKFMSAGQPELSKRVVVSKGRIMDQPQVEKKKPWYARLSVVSALLGIIASLLGYIFGIRGEGRRRKQQVTASYKPPPPPLDDATFQAMLTTRRYRLVFNPINGRNKEITFISDGQIGLGRNNNENLWRVVDGHLEILAVDGTVYSRFRYNRAKDRLEHTNDHDTKSIRDQYIDPIPETYGRTT